MMSKKSILNKPETWHQRLSNFLMMPFSMKHPVLCIRYTAYMKASTHIKNGLRGTRSGSCRRGVSISCLSGGGVLLRIGL